MFKYTVRHKFGKIPTLTSFASSKGEIEKITLIQITDKKWQLVLDGKLVTVENALIAVNIKKHDNI